MNDNLFKTNIEKYKLIFGDFYMHILFEKKKKVKDLISEYNDILNEENIIFDNIIDGILSELHVNSFKTLLYEFHKYKVKNNIGFDEYTEKIKRPEFHNEFEKKYPELLSLIKKRADFKIDLAREILFEFRNDLKNIQENIDADIVNIHSLNLDYGDSHNKGKTVTLVQTNCNTIVYKPHNLYNDILLKEIVNILNSELKIKMETITTLSSSNHGWQKFVVNRACETEKEVYNYYYRLGVYLSIFYMFQTEDIHFENIISSGEYPFILDLETLIISRQEQKKEENIETALNKFFSIINGSVLSTMILPVNYKFSVFDVDISSLSNKDEESVKWESYMIVDEGTDNIRLCKQASPIIKENSKVYLKSSLISPLDYKKALKDGFEKGFNLISNNKKQIYNTVLNFENISVRHIPKPTTVYFKFLMASTHPYYLGNKNNYMTLLSKFKSGGNMRLASAEIESLMNGDIPIFTQQLNSFDIKSSDQVVVENYFSNTPLTSFRKRLFSMNDSELDNQLNYIDLSIISDGKTNFENFKHQELQGDSIDAILESVGTYLKDNAILHNNTATWIMHDISSKSEKIYLSPLTFSIYHHSGVLILLLELYKQSDDTEFLNLAEMGLKGILQSLNISDINDISAFEGKGALIYLCAKFYKFTKNQYYFDKLLEIVESINVVDYKETEIDFVTGLSGTILILSNCYQKFGTNILKEKAKDLAEIMIRKYEKSISTLNGFAHGKSGYSLSLASIYKITKNKEYLHYVSSSIREEDLFYDEKNNNWEDLRNKGNYDAVYWCHGAPGIALSRSKIQNLIQEEDLPLKLSIDNAISKCVNDGFNEKMNHSLCHGISGNLDILIELQNIFSSHELENTINRESQNLLSQLFQNGYKSGINSKIPVQNFMLGKFGIAYTLLRIKDPSIPCILTFEI
ncbi:type 2 lantipeptide synthetase LanM [Staphylococcus succinus]|uniref:type 2 lanthipeptide synthetase LanM n=1 Tax=Staphylococcus succinus TaxID=61015 RepID=UPI000E67A06A|nr:type 2 lanthipeptide synthetase LanM [Staphylococcus succinus]RIN36943.1 type 2 lantipeptide synthetase LanM [Staphylococcus succinus]